jgi:hypothetical protein
MTISVRLPWTLQAAFSLLEWVTNKLEDVATLLAKADALSSLTLSDAFLESPVSEKYHYLVALNEVIVALRKKSDDVLVTMRHWLAQAD